MKRIKSGIVSNGRRGFSKRTSVMNFDMICILRSVMRRCTRFVNQSSNRTSRPAALYSAFDVDAYLKVLSNATLIPFDKSDTYKIPISVAVKWIIQNSKRWGFVEVPWFKSRKSVWGFGEYLESRSIKHVFFFFFKKKPKKKQNIFTKANKSSDTLESSLVGSEVWLKVGKIMRKICGCEVPKKWANQTSVAQFFTHARGLWL